MFVVVACAVATMASCRSEGSSEDTAAPTVAPTAAPASTKATSVDTTAAGSGASFGSLENVCGPGAPTSAPTQGVTATEIQVSVFTDMGFTHSTEFPDAAKVFTSWCNEQGGINGRKIVPNTRDARLTEDRQRMIEACASDFAVVGGGASFDQAGVKERLTCTLPELPAQVVSVANTGSDLQVMITPFNPGYDGYEGYFKWLVDEAHPTSKESVGIIAGDVPVTKDIGDQQKVLLEGLGATVSYYDLYPAAGASDWTPYAQAIKDGGVKGLIFLGDFRNLAKLEQSLTDIGYTPEWIDANSNAYNPEFLQLAADSLDNQTNYIPAGIYPLEMAADNPATKEMLDLYAKYLPDAKITLPSVQAFSSWLLFAKAAGQCGDDLTRRCLYDSAVALHDGWDGGGLTAPTTLPDGGPGVCFNAMKATPAGWVPAGVTSDSGFFRCTRLTIDVPANGKPLTLADVGKTMDDVQ